MKTGICEKHGRVMLHEDPCHECRNDMEMNSIRKITFDASDSLEHDPILQKKNLI